MRQIGSYGCPRLETEVRGNLEVFSVSEILSVEVRIRAFSGDPFRECETLTAALGSAEEVGSCLWSRERQVQEPFHAGLCGRRSELYL